MFALFLHMLFWNVDRNLRIYATDTDPAKYSGIILYLLVCLALKVNQFIDF